MIEAHKNINETTYHLSKHMEYILILLLLGR